MLSKLSSSLRSTLAVVAGCFFVNSAALAASPAVERYPDQPVNMYLPFPAGGVTDATMRKIADRFQALTGQPMIIQNRPGRTNALSALVAAKPDGYTLSLVGRSQMITHWLLGDKMPFDPINDFTWIDTLVTSWFGVFVAADSPYQSVADLIEDARRNPEKIAYGTAFGVGGLTHAPMHQLAESQGVKMNYIPYKGDADSIRALMGGDVKAIVAAGSAMPYVESGRMRLLGWLSRVPHPKYPDVKTFKDMGYDVEAYSIVGLGGPKGMDPALATKISSIFQRILSEPETREFMLGVFQNPELSSPQAFRAWAEQQLDKERQNLDAFGLLNSGAN